MITKFKSSWLKSKACLRRSSVHSLRAITPILLNCLFKPKWTDSYINTYGYIYFYISVHHILFYVQSLVRILCYFCKQREILTITNRILMYVLELGNCKHVRQWLGSWEYLHSRSHYHNEEQLRGVRQWSVSRQFAGRPMTKVTYLIINFSPISEIILAKNSQLKYTTF